jgi:hypothetical protein
VAVFVLSPVRTPYDSWFVIHTAASLVEGSWGSLEAFADLHPGHYSLVWPEGRPVMSCYPVGSALFALPLVAALKLAVGSLTPFLRSIPYLTMHLEAWTAALWCAAAALLLRREVLVRTADERVALLAVFVFAFCSPIWSTATRALWPHGPVVFCYLATLALLRDAERRPSRAAWAALPAAVAFVTRPTAIVLVVLAGAWVAMRRRRQLVPFLALGAGVATCWVLYTQARQGVLVDPYFYDPGRFGVRPTHPHPAWFHRLPGHLVSPGRGLFVFSPVFLLSAVGAWLRWRGPGLDRFDRFHLLFIGGHLGLVCLYSGWFGGHSFGPRYLTELTPALVLLLLPVLELCVASAPGARRTAARLAFVALAGLSFGIHARGATSQAPWAWNDDPSDVGAEGYDRLWRWDDLQFLRGDLARDYELLRVVALSQRVLLDEIRSSRRWQRAFAQGLDRGQRWTFGVGGAGRGALASGWYGAESWGVWSRDREAVLRIPLAREPAGDLTLEVVTRAVVTRESPALDLSVASPGVEIDAWSIDESSPVVTRTLRVPATAVARRSLELDFRIGAPRSPHSLGLEADRRELGVGLLSLRWVAEPSRAMR